MESTRNTFVHIQVQSWEKNTELQTLVEYCCSYILISKLLLCENSAWDD